MPQTPTPGQIRGKDAHHGRLLDDHDTARRLRAKHRSHYPARACPSHPGDPDGAEACRATERAVADSAEAVQDYEAELVEKSRRKRKGAKA